MNELRSRMNAGCTLLLTAGLALSLAFRPIDSAIHWIVEESAILDQTTPAALAATKAIALITLGPLILGALCYILSNGLGRTFDRILSFWWAGLKSGIACLLLFLPGIIVQQVLRHPANPGILVAPGSSVAWLYTLSLVLLCVAAPFWSLLLIRHLPMTVLRGTLFERFNSDGSHGVGDAVQPPASTGRPASPSAR